MEQMDDLQPNNSGVHFSLHAGSITNQLASLSVNDETLTTQNPSYKGNSCDSEMSNVSSFDSIKDSPLDDVFPEDRQAAASVQR